MIGTGFTVMFTLMLAVALLGITMFGLVVALEAIVMRNRPREIET